MTSAAPSVGSSPLLAVSCFLLSLRVRLPGFQLVPLSVVALHHPAMPLRKKHSTRWSRQKGWRTDRRGRESCWRIGLAGLPVFLATEVSYGVALMHHQHFSLLFVASLLRRCCCVCLG